MTAAQQRQIRTLQRDHGCITVERDEENDAHVFVTVSDGQGWARELILDADGTYDPYAIL